MILIMHQRGAFDRFLVYYEIVKKKSLIVFKRIKLYTKKTFIYFPLIFAHTVISFLYCKILTFTIWVIPDFHSAVFPFPFLLSIFCFMLPFLPPLFNFHYFFVCLQNKLLRCIFVFCFLRSFLSHRQRQLPNCNFHQEKEKVRYVIFF